MLSNINSGALRGSCLLIIQDEGHVDCVALHYVIKKGLCNVVAICNKSDPIGDRVSLVYLRSVQVISEIIEVIVPKLPQIVQVDSPGLVLDNLHVPHLEDECLFPLFVEDSLDGLELDLLNFLPFVIVNKTKGVSEHAVLGELVDRIGPGIPHSNAYEGKGFAGMCEYVLPLREMMKGDSLVFSFIFSVMIVEAIEGM